MIRRLMPLRPPEVGTNKEAKETREKNCMQLLVLRNRIRTIFVLSIKYGHKGRVSIRGFSWYLNISIIFWEQIATYRGHALLKTLNQMELWLCVYYVLKVGGVFTHQSYMGLIN